MLEFENEALNEGKRSHSNWAGKEHHVDHQNQERVLNYIKEMYEHKTVPLITENINGDEVFIGGYDDFVKHITEQEYKESNKSDS